MPYNLPSDINNGFPYHNKTSYSFPETRCLPSPSHALPCRDQRHGLKHGISRSRTNATPMAV
ncbi:hypothetical protein [Vulcanisaeta sp. JCM 16161]|uniref:hypothetical protein n=1 Tax=Vulcanisaeta sp. JCM 16161 TaxID=1295372 RepID=UPI001FB306D5|nr:hypothetical protein [Vulcanisaeta sp. JCM 16161]